MRALFDKTKVAARLPCGPEARAFAFTIIELLVAAAVFMLMLTILFGAISQFNSAWSQSQGQKNRRESARTLLDLISRDLQATIPPLSGVGTNAVSFELYNGAVGDTNSQALFWQTTLPVNRSKSDVATVGYFVNADHSLYRLYTNAPLAGLWAQTNSVGGPNYNNLLAEGVLRMAVTLFNKDGTVSSNTATYATNLPAAAEITLVLADDRTLLKHPALVVTNLAGPLPQGVQLFRTRIEIPSSP